MNDKMKTIQLREKDNKGRIYIYYIGDVWKAFGRSAYYVHQFYPELHIVEDDKQSAAGTHISIPDEYLLRLSEENLVFAGDDYIQVKVPATLLCQSK
ncbi:MULTISPECIES: hypothetical protein [Bacteroides]|uniref:Uncharacterized protein n=1 Tax=Bacteroides oleiciplenus YIT 12058 TaxID=742727 RepID=K9E8B3_9BACE|nr:MULTISPECIES: hypothetical protein [Bacteroides]EKU92116.1 hypothetical protein HMPREF9447_00566 [Bacteroides oleiciplenus YIT 12058]UYI66013.1 MAG: hypothetical protein OGM04_11535 [Bacteroides ovatus]